jgi:hypothetical protein
VFVWNRMSVRALFCANRTRGSLGGGRGRPRGRLVRSGQKAVCTSLLSHPDGAALACSFGTEGRSERCSVPADLVVGTSAGSGVRLEQNVGPSAVLCQPNTRKPRRGRGRPRRRLVRGLMSGIRLGQKAVCTSLLSQRNGAALVRSFGTEPRSERCSVPTDLVVGASAGSCVRLEQSVGPSDVLCQPNTRKPRRGRGRPRRRHVRGLRCSFGTECRSERCSVPTEHEEASARPGRPRRRLVRGLMSGVRLGQKAVCTSLLSQRNGAALVSSFGTESRSERCSVPTERAGRGGEGRGVRGPL